MQVSSILSRNSISLAIVVCVGLFLAWFFIDIITYIMIALVLSAILQVPTNYISQTHFLGIRIPRSLAVLISFALLVGALGLFGFLFAPLILIQIEVLGNLDSNKIIENLILPAGYAEERLIELHVIKSKGDLVDTLKNYLNMPLTANADMSSFFNRLFDFTRTLLIGLLATLFITFYILKEKGALKRYFFSFIPNSYFEVFVTAFIKIEKMLAKYLLGILLQMLSIFSIESFGLIMVDVEYAVTIAVFSATVNLIPFLGPIMGTSFGLIVGLSTNPGLVQPQDYFELGTKILAVFGAVHFIDNVLLQPAIFSRSVKAHPLEIFIVIFMGATINGPLGMVLAIPTYTIIKITLMEFYKGYMQYKVFKSTNT